MSCEGQAATLRRQLEALSYDASGLTAAAAPLVAALLADLVKATDSYRALQAKCSDAGQETQTVKYQVDVLKREVGRLTAENNRLHQDLLQGAEARATQEAAAYQRSKELEAQAAEQHFSKQQALERAAALERERDGLRAKVRDLLSFRQHHAGDEGELKAAFSHMTITAPLDSKPSPAAQAKTSRGAISLIKAADSRILALEADLRRKDAELQALTLHLQQAKDAVAQREGEIARLSAQLAQGPDVDRLAQQYRNEANEAVILQLNQQVEALTTELTQLQQRAVDRSTLEAAQQAQQQAEARANALTTERESVAREVEQMQAALVRLQQEALGESAARQKLGRVRSTLEGVRAEKALLEGQLTHAEAKVAELRDKLEQREVAFRKAQHKCRLLEDELSELRRQAREGSSSHSAGRGAAADLQSRCDSLAAELETSRRLQAEAAAQAAAVTAERAALMQQVQELMQEVQQTQQQLATTAAVAAASNSPAQGAGRVAESTAASGEADAADARRQLALKQEAVEQLEFERDELLVKLGEAENRVVELTAAAAAAAAASQQPAQQPEHQAQRSGTLAGKPQHLAGQCSGDDDAGWRLAAGSADRQALEAAQQQVQQLQGRVSELESQAAAMQAELAAASAGSSSAAVADAAAADLRRQLQERNQEIADLTALSIKADATVQQYMTQLRSMATELRAAELRLGDAEGELARRAEEIQRHDAEVTDLRGAVGALDAERDSLQAELDRRAEVAAAEAEALAAERQRAQDTERALAATEARLAAATSCIQEQEQAGKQLRGELEALGQHVAGVEAEYVALRDEYHAVTDDLAALVKENQAVNAQLASMTAERGELAEQIKVQSTRSHYNEQLARAREADVAELRTAYEALSHENQRLQQSLTELTRELQARDTELMTKSEELAGLHEAQRSAQSQINMYISDLQAYERQLDAMNRAMKRGDEAADGLDRERQALLEQLRAAELVRFQLERGQEALQRQLVHAEGGIGVLEARLADAQSDAEALRHRIALEQAKVGELEGLLAIARADQYKRDAVAAESGADRQLASLQEQKQLLEQQVATLQRQVDGLVARREAQDEELGQLRARLAGEFDLGASRGSKEAAQRGEALAAQLAEARQRCSEYAAEAEALRAEAARLQGARDGAEAALRAALGELEEVKGLLVAGSTAGQEHMAAAGEGAPDGSDVGGFSGSRAADARLTQLEQQNQQLAAQLAALQAGAGQHQEATADVLGKLAELQQENDRLMDLLGHMDSERSRLARERHDLSAELVHLRAQAAAGNTSGAAAATGAHGNGATGGAGGGGGGSGASAARQQQLEGELERERQRRQQAEQDFQRLLSSMELLQATTPSSSSPSSSISGAGSILHGGNSGGDGGRGSMSHGLSALPAAELSQLQEAVSQLQRENEGLREELQRTQDSYCTAAAATSSLQQIAQGLSCIGSGSSVGVSGRASVAGSRGLHSRAGSSWQ